MPHEGILPNGDDRVWRDELQLWTFDIVVYYVDVEFLFDTVFTASLNKVRCDAPVDGSYWCNYQIYLPRNRQLFGLFMPARARFGPQGREWTVVEVPASPPLKRDPYAELDVAADRIRSQQNSTTNLCFAWGAC